MALTTISKLVGLDDAQLFPVTADTGSSYTCGAAIDIPGVKTLKLDLVFDSKDLTGDNVTLDFWSKAIGCDFELTFAKMDLNILATVLGADLVASGVTPSQKQTLSVLESNQAAAFQLQGLILGTDTDNAVASARIALMKCKINSQELINAAERDASTMSIKGRGYFTAKSFSRNSKTKKLLLDIILSETAESIAAITT